MNRKKIQAFIPTSSYRAITQASVHALSVGILVIVELTVMKVERLLTDKKLE
jgi:hypothetical protein